ncbi:beta-N-acetylhexosaminidase [Oceaniferula spumae]|uniref:beta-N-acetylhexosaminidase n=1 Tax=Oceaniferula spumae TaxID=2979115 RepID=A0AAT9FPK4_9BACT
MKAILILCALLTPFASVIAKAPSIVPKPQELRLIADKPFVLNASTQIRYDGNGGKAVAELLALGLRPATGFDLPVSQSDKRGGNSILLTIQSNLKNLKEEGYVLTVADGEITASAPTARGLFNATRTILQLFPPQIHSSEKASNVTWTATACSIKDTPAFPWRGMMLDVSRYFFTKEYVKRYLDMMALHKLNTLHWHLIDDAGWRIEIKKYPKLTEIGGFRGEGENRYGGFYTQEDIKEIVAYAAARNITIVPEIELPAHTLPALVAYPHLGCFGKQFQVPTRHFISQDLYCAGKETTWTFLEDVFTEVCELFPGKYIHIGGDEAKYSRWKKCPDCQERMKKEGLKSEHELQGWMTTRVEKFLKTKGRRIIGWDEILHCGVSSDAGIMTWHKPKTAVDGAKRGNPVVMSLTGHAYFDVAESKLPGEPPTAGWIPPISLEKSYQWHPVPNGLTAAEAKNILGVNGCIWTDQFLHNTKTLADKPGKGTTASEAYVDYLSLPRMAALAEVCWTNKESRDYDNFSGRMSTMLARYTVLDYQYRIPVPEVSIKPNPEKTYTLSATPAIAGGTIRYTLDGSAPTADSKALNGSINVAKIDQFRAATFGPNNQRRSLLYQHVDSSNKFAKHGKVIGKWKSGQVGDKKAKVVTFDATGHINSNGIYIITFQYTGGGERLDIDGIEVVRNDTDPVGKDMHHGFTGSQAKNNTYRIHVKNYETGASFKIKAHIYGDEGTDSNGVVLIRKK